MSSEDPGPDESFGKLLQHYQRAVDAQESENATGAVYDIFALAEQWCDENPSPDFALTLAAAECEERADWCCAESTYNQILALPEAEPAVEYKTHSSLAGLCHLLRRECDSMDHVRRATAAARRADLSILLSMALQNEARCLIRCGQTTDACIAIAEAISVIDDDRMYNQMNASLLTLRAECAVRNGALADARCDLEQASTRLERLAEMQIAAGLRSDLARWWSVTARLHAACGDLEKAVAAWQEAVSIGKHVASLPHAENVYTKVTVADMLKGLAETLLICGRADDAVAAFDERRGILDSVGVPEPDAE